MQADHLKDTQRSRPQSSSTDLCPSIETPSTLSDLDVELVSESLSGWQLDVVVTGSIGAIESVRFVRALRRLGASVQVWLSEGGAQFVTETALAWASARPVRTGFCGHQSHLATSDAVIVAPASAHFLSSLACGLTNSPSLAVTASHWGLGKPVLLLPNMHESLDASPRIKAQIDSLTREPGLSFLASRREEGKVKFPDPKTLADLSSKTLHQHRARERGEQPKTTLLTMGSTRGYFDDVRYISNYSSGALGTDIATELDRYGYPVRVICGPCERKPHASIERIDVETTADMDEAVARHVAQVDHGVFAASVLDYEPSEVASGKLSSGRSDWNVQFKPTAKILRHAQRLAGKRVGFKLQTAESPGHPEELAARYIEHFHLSMLVYNRLDQVSSDQHRATLFRPRDKTLLDHSEVDGKRALAQAIARFLRSD